MGLQPWWNTCLQILPSQRSQGRANLWHLQAPRKDPLQGTARGASATAPSTSAQLQTETLPFSLTGKKIKQKIPPSQTLLFVYKAEMHQNCVLQPSVRGGKKSWNRLHGKQWCSPHCVWAVIFPFSAHYQLLLFPITAFFPFIFFFFLKIDGFYKVFKGLYGPEVQPLLPTVFISFKGEYEEGGKE